MWFSAWIVAAIELMFFLTVIVRIKNIVGKYHLAQIEQNTKLESLQVALESSIPRVAARLLITELKLYYTLYLTFKRQTPKNIDSYSSNLSSYSLILKVILVLCLVEMIVVTLVIPEKWFIWKVAHLLLSLWAIVWIIADYNAMRYYTHEVKHNNLIIQMGLRCSGKIAFDDIVSAKVVNKGVPDFTFGPVSPKEEPDNLYLSAGEICNVLVEVKTPHNFIGLVKDFTGIKRIWLSINEPEVLVSKLSLAI